MTITDLMDNWDSISYDRKLDAMRAVIEYLSQPYQKDEALLAEILDPIYLEEQNDYFGTEGLEF